MRTAFARRSVLATAAVLVLATCTDRGSEPTRPVVPQVVSGAGAEVLVGAGNIARCDRTNDEATALLLDGIAGTVFTAGDNIYAGGALTDYQNCYGPSWGRHATRTRPTPGDEDYRTAGAAGYFAYFGAAAGQAGSGYYSYDLGAWHIVVLNSGTSMIVGSPQEQWLRADLAATTQPCVLAYWHFPRFSSFGTAVRSEVKPLWDALYAAQADVVLNGHYRLYERFALQNPAGGADPALGIRQFTVGTGGQGPDGTGTARPNSEVRASVFGVLKLTLESAAYTWQFVPVAGQTFTDEGSAACHGRPGAPPLPNQAPTASPAGPYESEATITFDGSASSDVDNNLPLTYAWDFGDGTTGSGVAPTKTYDANGTYTATLVVSDALGLASTVATAAVTIANVAPTVSAGADAEFEIGPPFTLNATFGDEGGAIDAPWAWTVTWGDGAGTNGNAATAGDPITASHLYLSNGEYTVRVSVTDKDGGTGTDETVVTVRDQNAVAVLVGAGDIAECGVDDSEHTARLLDAIPGTVIALGDNAYLSGSITDYMNCYHPTWGRHKARTKPAVGNHDYDGTPGAAGYYEYFGAAAGDPTKGYYSYTAGEWLVLVLNTASGSANRSATSPQVQWLRGELAATTRPCQVAYMHHPQFTSAEDRSDGEWNVIDLWNAMFEGGVDLVIAAHDHLYDRFAPMRPNGTLDPLFGIRQITVGTGGGEGLYGWGNIQPNSESRNNQTFGVLKLTLTAGAYTWDFVPVAGSTYTDHGTGTCHDRPGGAPPPNQAPSANAGGPYQADNRLTFSGSGSTDPDNNLPLTYAWTFGDGTTGTGVAPIKTYVADGSYTATLVVTDALGLPSAPASTAVTIANVAPAVNAGPDASVPAAAVFNLTATFGDAGGAADAPWTWTIAWGDGVTTTGSSASLGSPIAASHTYVTEGPQTLRVTVTDKDGGSGFDEAIVTVIPLPPNQPPTANPGGPYAADATVIFTGASSSDPDNNVPLTYAWTFGDGTSGSGVSPTKTYGANGNYTATLVVTDALGLAGAPATTTVTIANVAPTVNAGSDQTASVGVPFAVSATFGDPGGSADAPWGWTIAWGDGATSTGSTASLGGPVAASHSYAAAGQFTVRVTVTDKDAGAGWDEAVVVVSNNILVGAGNIARCDRQNDEATALLLDAIPGTVFTAGDNIRGSAALSDYQNCYGPSWGRHWARTRPAAGDKDYATPGAAGYFAYFGAAAGPSGKGYDSYDVGSWHIVVLNSGISMAVGSTQEVWLRTDLAATTKPCVLAYWHLPRFSSSGVATRTSIKPLWDALYAAGADVVVNADARVYERFAPQTPGGTADAARGIRQFTVGTGGQGTDNFSTPRPNSQVRASGVYGVLKLTLGVNSYTWQFVPVAGQTFTDAGTTACH